MTSIISWWKKEPTLWACEVTVRHRSSKSPGAHSEEPVCASLNKDDAASQWSSTLICSCQWCHFFFWLLKFAKTPQGNKTYSWPHTCLKQPQDVKTFSPRRQIQDGCCKKQRDTECVLAWWMADDVNRSNVLDSKNPALLLFCKCQDLAYTNCKVLTFTWATDIFFVMFPALNMFSVPSTFPALKFVLNA